MEFTTDSYIEIGSSHNVCEDYALHGIIDDVVPYIIVCDGCSSSKMTDFGARILAHSCQKTLFNTYRNGILDEIDGGILHNPVLRAYMFPQIKHTAMESVEKFNLMYNICDATLLYAFIYNEKLYVHGYGDGNVIIKMKDGSIKRYHLYYDSNAPFYISYDMDYMRKKGYEGQFGDKQFHVDIYLNQSKVESGTFPHNITYNTDMDVNEIEAITLASDGMETFSHSHKRLCEDPAPLAEEIDSLTPHNMMQRMVAYKNHKGVFVKRRMKRMKQEVESIQGEHYDDISCATIWVDHGKKS